MRRSEKRRYVLVASTVVGLVGIVSVYQAGAHGGDLVYKYAGGIGIRSGDPADVERLLVTGLYQQAQLDRILQGYEDFMEFDPRELHLIEALRTLRLIHYAA